MKILVTGGCGFVGRHVAIAARDRGHDVTTADLPKASNGPDIELDITDAEGVADCVEGFNVVIHCAAVVGPIPAKENPFLTVQANVTGTANILEAARGRDTRVVYLSTATLYGHRPDLKPLRESDVPHPISHYDATKYAAEVVCRSYREDFEVDVVCVRTGFVYGPGHSTGEYFVESAFRDQPVTQESGADSPCDFTYVKDTARGLVLAAEHEDMPELVYNVTGGVLRTRGEFADIVREHFPDATIEIGSGRNEAMHLRGPCVIELAKRDFGYMPEFDIEGGIADWVRGLRADPEKR